MAREPAAVRALVGHLLPLVHRRVARALVRRSPAGRDVRQEVEDLAQEVFAGLLANGGRRLLAWSPDRGSAATFFGLVTERLVANALASPRRTPWRARPPAPAPAPADPTHALESRAVLRALGERMLEALSERDAALFEMLFVRGQDDAEVRETLGLSRDALYQARRRLRGRLRALAADLVEDGEPDPGAGEEGG